MSHMLASVFLDESTNTVQYRAHYSSLCIILKFQSAGHVLPRFVCNSAFFFYQFYESTVTDRITAASSACCHTRNITVPTGEADSAELKPCCCSKYIQCRERDWLFSLTLNTWSRAVQRLVPILQLKKGALAFESAELKQNNKERCNMKSWYAEVNACGWSIDTSPTCSTASRPAGG